MTEPYQHRVLTLIINPASGGGRAGRQAQEIADQVRARGHDVRVHVTTSLNDGQAAAVEAVAAGRMAVAVGGDGIVSAVANAVAAASSLGGDDGDQPHGPKMGLLPMGRGNDFARALGFHHLDKALAVLSTGVGRKVDLGYIAGRYFTCIASMGFDSRVIESAARIKLVKGGLVYPFATIKALLKWKPAEFTVTTEAGSESICGFSVAVANGGYFGAGMHLAPASSLTDGLLDVVTISQVSRLRFLVQGPKVFKGTHVSNPEVQTRKAAKVTLSSTRNFTVYADGEPIGPAPVTIEIRPAALDLLVPSE